jgi:hypothetical protein
MSSIEDILLSGCGAMGSKRVLEFFHKRPQRFSAHSAVPSIWLKLQELEQQSRREAG